MERKEIRIPAMDEALNQLFTTAAKNKGQTRTEFLRPRIRKIVDDFPEALKEKRSISTNELRISGIPADIKSELEIVAENLGVTPAQLLRIELHKLSGQIPDWMKINPEQ